MRLALTEYLNALDCPVPRDLIREIDALMECRSSLEKADARIIYLESALVEMNNRMSAIESQVHYEDLS